MSVIAGHAHSATVVALRDSEIIALPRAAFFEAVEHDPAVMIEISRLMIRRARMSGDRVRDLPAELRQEVIGRLVAWRAPPAWIARIREPVPLDEAGQQGVFGETLPLGLKLVD